MTKDPHGKIVLTERKRTKESWDEVWRWYSSSEKDDELANNVEMAVERMGLEFKLQRIQL